MKEIYHITENVSFKSGGVRTILLLLNDYLKTQNMSSNIITNLKEETDDFIRFETNMPWFYNKNIKPFLKNLDNSNAIFHLHGTYTYNQFIGSEVAIEKQIPYILSPHGMLEPWILSKSALKKKTYLQYILNKVLKNAKVLHAITPLEKENLFKLTNHKNIIEIPNLIQFDLIPKNLSYNQTEDYFVFVGRIDPKKGIDLIIKAIYQLGKNNIKLKILGHENEYSSSLKKTINQLGLTSQIEFLGGVFDETKFKLISNARALIAPSFSEAIGMVNLEAAACKTPVITTYQTGLDKDFGKNGGVLINPSIDELKIELQNSINWSDFERIERGRLLQQFVFENYSWEKKGNLWKELYYKI